MKRWASTLGVEPKAFDAFLWRWTQRYVRGRRWLTRPFLKYADYVGARQGWTMFSGPRRNSGRYEVEVEIDRTFVSVFRTQDSRATWNRRQFEHNRLRKLLAKLTTHPQLPAYNELTKWIARRAAEDFPEATRCKISLYTWPMLSPEELRSGKKRKETRTRSQIFDLEAMR